MSQDSSLHNRRSIRLKGYDYTQSSGYFVTVVTFRRKPLFGVITHGEMELSGMGRIADEYWRHIPDHFPFVELGSYVIMPNHLHGILIINDGRGTIYRAPTVADHRAPISATEQFQKPITGSIPTIIRTYKASVTRRIRLEMGPIDIWQRNFYEHIIRNKAEHQHIHLYIESNIANWASDPENVSLTS